jgi:hypothetical protein
LQFVHHSNCTQSNIREEGAERNRQMAAIRDDGDDTKRGGFADKPLPSPSPSPPTTKQTMEELLRLMQ